MSYFGCFVAMLAAVACVRDAAADELHLTLPPVMFAVPDIESAIYYDNIVLTESPESYRFEFTCDLGTQQETRWTVTPRDSSRGDHPVGVRVLDADGQVLASAKTILRVSARAAGHGDELRLLIVGDSLTHASAYPNELSRLLSQPGNPKLTMLGTHKHGRVVEGVAHEGYGGWTNALSSNTSLTPMGRIASEVAHSFILATMGSRHSTSRDI
jgi:hypothetical protein